MSGQLIKKKSWNDFRIIIIIIIIIITIK